MKVLSRTQSSQCRSLLADREPSCELAPADFSALIRWNCLDDEDPLWHLPSAQSATAKIQKIGLVHAQRCDHTCRHFLIAQRRRATKNKRLAHAGEAQQMRLHLCRIHLFPGDINYIRHPADDPTSVRGLR